ncbi:CrcB family protein [Streptomyces ficellus]|uniref:Fluoride-specific ion channel FluC n=1 Tax=Streptomyces ficellus TaxID=1977088 RepID=A0ABT7Z1G5_9ACTN|nr:CrcB family protein [Streptomyces ficellus]MDN3293305.1 CrcB family protein [Streptomyces ficellus]
MTAPRKTCDRPPRPFRSSRPSGLSRPWRERVPVVGVVALGGAIGAGARYGASLVWPAAVGGFPWATLCVNAVGCALIGVFMVLVGDVWAAHRLVRPFFGTGVLGGFTTFSTYALDIQQLAARGRAVAAVAYLGLTLLAALGAVAGAVWLTRRVLLVRYAAGREREGAR